MELILKCMNPGCPEESIRFTLAGDSDLVRLNELVNEPEIARYLNLIPPVPLQKTLDFWRLIQGRGSLLWCIRDKLRIIGCIGVLPDEPGTKLSHIAAFFIYLEPACWGMGIGEKALRFLEAEVRDRDFYRLECSVAAPNSRAIRLYEKAGFTREGVKRKAFRDDDGYADMVIMGKLLD
jgi:putative acetyltransferase